MERPEAEETGFVDWNSAAGKYQRIVFRWLSAVGDTEEIDMALERPTHDPNRAGRGQVPKGGNWSVLLPTIWEYLTSSAWADDSVRRTSTLLIFAEDGLIKCCLHDRDVQRSAWSSGESEEECLSTLEDKLAKNTVEWRRDQKGSKK